MSAISRAFPRALPVLFVACLALLATLVPGSAALDWHSDDPSRLIGYLIWASLAAILQVGTRRSDRLLPFSLVFTLLGVVELSLPEALLLACLPAALQQRGGSSWPSRLLDAVGAVAAAALAVTVAQRVFRSQVAPDSVLGKPLRLLLAGAAFFILNSYPAAVLAAFRPGLSARRRLWRFQAGSLAHHAGCALVAGLLHFANLVGNWQTSLLVLPVVYLVFRSYLLHMRRLEDGLRHAEEIAALHLRTMETLALAIEAKDETTHRHLQRVQVYALAVGRDLGLSATELEALRAAALLHDIGKIAVPEHIISKPGKLTPEEFAKMKVHPIVGAEIVERVKFPYPVAPIVLSHHEKWNGQGYPNGLAGEEIPIGARILAAVDCLDALASDRQYRKALPLDRAMQVVSAESGTSFDPKVVEVLQRRYVELEAAAVAQSQIDPPRLSLHCTVERGQAPAAGFAMPAVRLRRQAQADAGQVDQDSSAAARAALLGVCTLADTAAAPPTVEELIALLSLRLRPLIPHALCVLSIQRDNHLEAECVVGAGKSGITPRPVPMGEGLSGWVAEHGRPILNGNPAVEPGLPATLRSAMAVPLRSSTDVFGVLAFYHEDSNAFDSRHSEAASAIAPRLAAFLECTALHGAPTEPQIEARVALAEYSALRSRLEEATARGDDGRSLPISLIGVRLRPSAGRSVALPRTGREKAVQAVREALVAAAGGPALVAYLGHGEFAVLALHADPVLIGRAMAAVPPAVEYAAARLGCPPMDASVTAVRTPQDGDDAGQLLAELDRRLQDSRIRHGFPAPPAVAIR